VVWLNILYLGVFCSALGYFCYIYALRHMGPIVVTSFINLIPVVGAFGGMFILGERLSPIQLAGGAVVIAGVFLVNLRRS
jgi:drug/metabolite transporter (DMT)-like permease